MPSVASQYQAAIHIARIDADVDILHSAVADDSARYVTFLREVVERTGRLVGLWQSLGFVHGVLNTDNMSILGLTIDYGPYGFMDT